MALPPHNAALIQSAADGDPAAWDALFDAWLPTVLGWARRLGGPDVDAEDVAHDTFVSAISGLGALRDPVAFPRWLYRLNATALRKHRLDATRRPTSVDWTESVQAPTRSPRDVPGDLAVLRLVEQLPEAQREVLALCVMQELTREEAATLLDVPVGTVKSRLRLAMARFQELAAAAGMLDELREVGG